MKNDTPTPGYSFGMRLECIRDDRNLSLKKMAESVGVSPTTWRTYEKDLSFPSESTLWNLCGIYHVNREWLDTNCGGMYLDGYKPGDPLGELVSYTEKLKQDITNNLANYYGFGVEESDQFLDGILRRAKDMKR